MALPSFICVSTPNSFSRSISHVILPAQRVEEVVDLATPASVITTGLTQAEILSTPDLLNALHAKNPEFAKLDQDFWPIRSLRI